MPSKKFKPEPEIEIDYKLACRCCLKCDAEFYKLDSLTVARNIENEAADERIPLLRLLLFCIRAENVPELPQYICRGCSKSLQIAYYFLQNALRAHEILCHKLCPDKLKAQQAPSPPSRHNGQQIKQQQPQLPEEQEELDDDEALKVTPKPRQGTGHTCKVCGVVIYNRLELKQHIRLHTDVVAQSCKLCSFVAPKQRLLGEHYRTAHGLNEEQQLNPTTEPPSIVKTSPKRVKKENDDDSVVKVCTLEDMELLIPTVLRPEDYEHPQIDSEQLRDIEEQLAASMQSTAEAASPQQQLPAYSAQGEVQASNVSIGTEYLVLPDGSLQQVDGSGVVIEYINAAPESGKSSSSPNLLMQNLLAPSTAAEPANGLDFNVDELIVEEVLPHISTKTKVAAMKHKCGDCAKSFATLARLKSHQLTHSNLPKFFCDQCTFYSLRSSDLMLHYKAHHNIVAKGLQLQDGRNALEAADESRIFSCDMCLFETQSRGHLRVHYNSKHMMEPTEIQLRPSWTTDDGGSPTSRGSLKRAQQPPLAAEIPLGIKYPRGVNPARSEPPATATATPTLILTTSGLTATVNVPPVMVAATPAVSTTLPVVVGGGNSNTFAIFPEISTSLPVAATDTNAVPMFGDMQDFIDNTEVAAICTVPADGMPVVDGDDIVIDNNNISMDFDAENLFEDFEDDDDDDDDDEEEELEHGEEDDAENDDENENNDAAIDQNLLLTSDDDDVDDFDDEQSKHLQKPYCIYCNKKFTSQYKFENHMFVHRGLAPYRCELCTNIYNMKRALIRHYKAVHKRMPTREMVQAKGDKVTVDRTNIEKLHINEEKAPSVMCAKCPFECDLESEMRKHLNAHHGIIDGGSCHAGEVFIIRKLPFECPRCIRSFAAKRTLTRHLQRSHLVDTIIELQAPQTTTSSASLATTTTTSTAISTAISTATSTSSSDSAALPTNANASESATAMTAADRDRTTDEVKAAPEEDDFKMPDLNEGTPVTQLAAYLLSSSQGSAAAVTPTPIDAFDFDYDFMGDAQGSSTRRAPNSSYAASSLLNSSQELEPSPSPSPSPLKDLPRTPIYVCKQCNYTCDDLAKLNQHQTEQHANNNNNNLDDATTLSTLPPRRLYEFQCGICTSTYRTVTLLKFHMKRHTKRKYQCELCPKTFVIRTELETHQITHAKATPFKCEMDGCQKAFNYKHHLKRHQNASHLCKRVVCPMPECGKQFNTKSQFTEHMRTHRGNQAYKCPQCPRTYTRRKPLAMHSLRTHKLQLTDDDLAKVFRANVGYANPQDLPVLTSNGELLRRSCLEAAAAQEQNAELAEAVVNIMT